MTVECPVCNQSLAGMDEQKTLQHVNSCIDSHTVKDRTEKRKSSGSHQIQQLKSGVNEIKFEDFNSPLMKIQQVRDNKSQTARMAKTVINHPILSAQMLNNGNDVDPQPPKLSREMPFYKKIPNTCFAVDAFNYGRIPDVKCYFLTHAHADHYTHLSAKFDHGLIICTKITGNFVRNRLKVNPAFVQDVELNTLYEVCGVEFEFIDANHCPGSAIVLFHVPVSTQRSQLILHTGDFRAHQLHLQHQSLQLSRPIDILYLDTTYCKSQYTFPSQEVVLGQIQSLCKLVLKYEQNGAGSTKSLSSYSSGNSGTSILDTIVKDLGYTQTVGNKRRKYQRKDSRQNSITSYFGANKQSNNNPGDGDSDNEISEGCRPLHEYIWDIKHTQVLFVVGTYLLGKERVFMSMAKALGVKVYADADKRRILRYMDDEKINTLLTDDPLSTPLHLVKMHDLRSDRLGEYLTKFRQFKCIIGIKPTGWTFENDGGSSSKSQGVGGSKHQASSSLSKESEFKIVTQSSQVLILGIPYSEHSSFNDLKIFVQGLNNQVKSADGRPVGVRKIIPTVNTSKAETRQEMQAYFSDWMACPSPE
ncbi:hypothetical protein MIR68_002823 [Amoeboaphelidium protococcarum]|nr:hypothetical protein MIR68_002823 [Amoeboaphelidium protococcarum]